MEKAELIITDALEKIEQTIYDSPIPRLRTDDRLRIVNSDEISDMIADVKTQLPADLNDLAQGTVHLFGQAVTHHRIIENICAEYIRYISVSLVHISSNSLFCRNPEKTFQSPSGFPFIH